ncbi:starch-binding domain-containing protein 1 [Dipodomys spectabilis]|uniref:starch-binding domain-containing protein 1 n=1 Tax=Dipodomys spectabilis TaxID=105255 RepID=UPI001C53AE77|nr:starch-binding domain-containing protein 1 [Dipodomys spectabilis]
MGAVWSALLVGGGLAGALFVWLLRGDPGDAEPRKGAPPGEASAPGGDQEDGGGGLSPGLCKQELITKPEHLQESNGHLISASKGLDNLQEAMCAQKNLCGADGNKARQHCPAAQILDTHTLAASETGNSAGYSEALRNKSLESHGEERSFQKGQMTPASAATCFGKKLSSSDLPVDRVEGVSHAQLDSQAPADQEDWEVVSRHSSWGDVGLGGSIESSGLNVSQGMDCDNTCVELRGWEADGKVRSSDSQQVSIGFQVHYTTSTGAQFLAVTGDHESLGGWKTYIPLRNHKDGIWSHSLFLPADTVVEWKFVLVENGKVTRWEECSNRLLETGHEDKVVHRWWGVH